MKLHVQSGTNFPAIGSGPDEERDGVLHLLAATDEIRTTLLSLFEGEGLLCESSASLLSVHVGSQELVPTIKLLGAKLSSFEARQTRTVFQPRGGTLALEACLGAPTLDAFSARFESKWLRELIAAQRVTTVFQPIVLASQPSEVFAYECLLRGLSPTGEFLSPEPILGIARRAGWLGELDRVARVSALTRASHFKLAEKVFVNLSPVGLRDAQQTLDESLRAIDAAGMSTKQVVFEIVESEQIEELASLAWLVERYKKAGCQVALDDLGSGYSSLKMVAELQPDFVKIDMSLVRDVHRDAWRGTLVTGIIELAKELGMRSIAEGIETPQEMAWLRERGADLLQGYFLAKPAAVPPPVTFHYAGGRKVLLVDDSHAARRIGERVLASAGFEVRCADGLSEVKPLLVNWTPDIVLTDVNMPGGGGPEVGRYIKRALPNRATPVLLFSSLSNDELGALADSCEADGYISKKDGVDKLVIKLQDLRNEILW